MAASYQPQMRTLAYTITLTGLDASSVTSATLRYGAPGDTSIVLAVMLAQPQAGASITGSLALNEESERWLAAGMLYVQVEANGFSGASLRGTVSGRLFFGEPVLHLPLYVAPRPVAEMSVEPQALTFVSGTAEALTFTGSTLQGSAPPTDIVPLAAVMELKLRSPNTRPAWLHTDEQDRYDHADLQYVGVTSDAATGAALSPRRTPASTLGLPHGRTGQRPTKSPSASCLTSTTTAGTNIGWPTALPQHRSLAQGRLDHSSASCMTAQAAGCWRQQPLNGVPATAFDTNLFFGNAMILPVRLADLGLGAAWGNINFVVQTESTDTVEGQGGFVDRSPVLHYDPARPALLFSAPNALAPMYLDRPDTSVKVAVNPAGYPFNPPAGALVIHTHNGSGAHATVVNVNYRWPYAGYLPFIGQRAWP